MDRFIVAILITGIISFLSCSQQTEYFSDHEAADPVSLTDEQKSAWSEVQDGLNGAWGSIDLQYSKSIVPEAALSQSCVLAGWKGEKVSAQLVLWTKDSLANVSLLTEDLVSDNAVLPSSCINASYVGYVLANQSHPKCLCRIPAGLSSVLVPDIITGARTMDIPSESVRPVWITVDIPSDAVSGIYSTMITVRSAAIGECSFPMQIRVVDRLLPPPSDWNYHLDLWQHPSSVARIAGVPVWSDEHFDAMRPVMTRLANAGQKVITANLNKDPWNHQCYDAYENMIRWTFRKDGTWTYDYTVFDRWVTFMISLGIDKAINCYSMLPWNCELDYYDEASDKIVTVKADPGTDEFYFMWRPFLSDFRKHLIEKGWLSITNIAMDERKPEQMDAVVSLMDEVAPELGFALADNHSSFRKYANIKDICVARSQPVDHQDILQRRRNGFVTTFYVCCSTHYPNTFTYSQPYEAEMLVWYGIAKDYDGMLRWAYNSWQENPSYDSRFSHFASGDTYLVYPDNRSSMRFERLVDGIENAEKIRMLRNEAAISGVDMSGIDDILQKFIDLDISDKDIAWAEIIMKAGSILNE